MESPKWRVPGGSAVQACVGRGRTSSSSGRAQQKQAVTQEAEIRRETAGHGPSPATSCCSGAHARGTLPPSGRLLAHQCRLLGGRPNANAELLGPFRRPRESPLGAWLVLGTARGKEQAALQGGGAAAGRGRDYLDEGARLRPAGRHGRRAGPVGRVGAIGPSVSQQADSSSRRGTWARRDRQEESSASLQERRIPRPGRFFLSAIRERTAPATRARHRIRLACSAGRRGGHRPHG